MGEACDPLALTPEQRKEYRYEGPEFIYTFWAKHGPCSAPGCGHRTPLFTSPVIVVKTLSVKTWQGFRCRGGGAPFDVERAEARMAPDVPLVVADSEAPYAVMDAAGRFVCTQCGHVHEDKVAVDKGWSSQLPKAGWQNNKVSLTLLIHPDWMRGAPGSDADGEAFGGTAISPAEAIGRWFKERLGTLRLLEAPCDATLFSTSREDANADDQLSLLGLDHPIIEGLLEKYRTLASEDIGLVARSSHGRPGRLDSGSSIGSARRGRPGASCCGWRLILKDSVSPHGSIPRRTCCSPSREAGRCLRG
jgi:hypothetical protein